MLNIAIITNNYKPYSGGVVSSIDSFATTLRLLGHQVFIITLDFNNQIEKDPYIFRIYCPIKFIYKKNPMAIPWRAKNAIIDIFKNIKPDILHSQHPFLLGVSGFKVARKLNLPIVFTYHTKYEEYLHYIPLPKILTEPIIKKLALEYCNTIDGIITPSNSIYDFLKVNQISKPIEVIASGILPIFIMKKFKYKNRKMPFHLLTVSRFSKEKNIQFLLEAFYNINRNDFVLTLIGYGLELQNLKNYAYKKLNLSENKVVFIEKPDKETISSFYKLADLFIFSSTTETQGLVLAESMASGTPVIALEATGTSDIIKSGINGFLINSIEDMVSKILLVYNDIDLHKNMQYQAWLTSQMYNPFHTTKNLINFYQKIIDKKKPIQ